MNRKIRILQFPIANSYGGITHYALNNWKWMDKEKFQCDFATMSKKLDFAEDVYATGSKIHYISRYAEEDERQFINEFKKILLEGKYDIVHLHTKQWKSFQVEHLAKEAGISKIIVHAHNTGIDTRDFELRQREIELHNNMLNLLTENIATDFWACSHMAAKFLFADKIPQEKIKVMYNAIDVDCFKYKEAVRKKTRYKLGIDDKFVIGHVGRFVYQKNHDFLIDVFSHIYQQKENVVLLLIGEGELKGKIQKKVETLGLHNRVMFLGKRDDVADLLQAMDVFVLPSRFEGLPIAAVEAQAAGLKCFCSDTITKEVSLNENLELIPLESRLWAKRILSFMQNDKCLEDRENTNLELYDIKNHISLIENEYVRGFY